MHRAFEVFGKRRVLLAVIHVVGERQMMAGLKIVLEGGADGVFLIGHGMDHWTLSRHYELARQRYPYAWIGLNCLDLPTDRVFGEVSAGVSGVWADDGGFRSGPNPLHMAEINDKMRWIHYPDPRGLYFGGIAFKGQATVPEADLPRVTADAREYMDVITTSGPGTGRPASPRKLDIMRAAAGDFPIALASGVTPANIGDYRDAVNFFLVASSFTDPETEMVDVGRFQALVDAFRAL